MTENTNNTTPPVEKPLESWKEIATYLDRDVSTVRRWEKNEGLPVRRHLHEARSSVYAYPSELDQWREGRKPGAAPMTGWLWQRPARAVAMTATLLLALVTVGSGPVLTPANAANGEPGSGITTRQVWDNGDATGSPSPDGRYLSYVNWLTGDMAVRNLATGENRNLTDEGTWEGPDQFGYYSVWSPDSQQVAYAWFNKDIYELRTVGLEGGKPHVLYRNRDIEWIRAHDWSEDGEFILTLLGRKDRTNQIVLVSVSDGTVQVLKTLDWRRPLIMSFSPDGRTIAYDLVPDKDADISAGRDIFLLATDGSGESMLVRHPANDYGAVWTPDGKGIVFVSDRGGAVGAYLMLVEEGKPQATPRLLKRNVGRMFPMAFTRKGAFYYGYANFENGGNIYLAAFDPATGKVQGDPERAIQRFEGENTSPAWSPDGKYMAYLSRRGSSPFGAGSWSIRIRTVGTGEERELSPNLRSLRNYRYSPPQWSPDGRFLLVSGVDGKGRWGLFRIDVETGKAVLEVQHQDNRVFRPAWSPDGKTIFFLRQQIQATSYPRSIVAHDIESGQEKALYRGEGIIGLAVSPTGGHLAFFDREDGRAVLKILPVQGGEPRKVFSAPGASVPYFVGLAWSPDERHLFWSQHVSEGGRALSPWPEVPTLALWRISAEGGEPQRLGIEAEVLRDITVHPDGKRLSFTAGHPAHAEVWAMENFLPEQKVAQVKK